MMRKGLMLAAASVFVLSACQRAENAAPGSPTADAAVESAAPATDLAVDQSAPPAISAPLAPVASIASAYRYALSLPRNQGAEVMSRHEQTCATAGPGLCQVISAQADWVSRDPGGRLELRGQPEWINRFRAGLATEARNAGGRLDEAVTEGENLTVDIDTAATGATTTASLTERIRALQAQRGGTMAQRLEVERQLAELQAQHDARQITLRALNDRVRSARLTLDYRPGGVMAADSPTRPVARALGDAFGLSMGMIAVLITLGSAALPVAGVVGITWWALRRRRRTAATA